MAAVTSIRNFIRTLAGTLILAIASSIINNSLRSKIQALGLPADAVSAIVGNPILISSKNNEYGLTDAQRTDLARAFTRGIQISYYVATAFLVCAVFVSVFVIQHHSLKREDDVKGKADAKVYVLFHTLVYVSNVLYRWLAERKAKKDSKAHKDTSGEKE